MISDKLTEVRNGLHNKRDPDSTLAGTGLELKGLNDKVDGVVSLYSRIEWNPVDFRGFLSDFSKAGIGFLNSAVEYTMTIGEGSEQLFQRMIDVGVAVFRPLAML